MITVAPCFRHGPTHWIAACADCTAWHLPAQRAARLSSPAAAPPVPRPVAVMSRPA